MPKYFLVVLTLVPILTAQTRITGSGTDKINASVRGVDGFIYATGVTNSADFPTTSEPLSRPSLEDFRPFVIKLNAQGQVLYSTLIPAPTSSPQSIAVNAKGEVLIAGQSVELGQIRFPITPGAVGEGGANAGFILKLDAAGSKILVGIRGYGSGMVAYDAEDNIFIAGAAYGDTEIRPTTGAFQITHKVRGCAGNGFVGISCFYQYVAKISADGKKLLYSTFLTGSFGAQPAALLIDATGNAIIAGTTNSSDYPVTAGSYQQDYRSASPPPPTDSFRGSSNPPPVSGYITKLNAAGTGLVWSTYFSGSGAESISSMRLADSGGLFFTGLSSSHDLPMAQAMPRDCPLGYFPEVPYVAELSADGKTLVSSHYVYDADAYSVDRIQILPNGTVEIIQHPPLPFSDSPYVCLVDSADNTRLSQMSPGQLVTLFGDFIMGTKVLINGIPAPLLYISARQINLQVPLEISGQQQVQLSVVYPDQTGNARPVEMVKRAPSVFLDLTRPLSPLAICSDMGFSPGYPAIVRNEDGTLNSCEHRAFKGSVVTFYLNGLGQTAPLVTLSSPQAGQILAVEADPDSPSGVWRVIVRLATNASSGPLEPRIDGARLRYGFLAVWIIQ